MTPVPIGWGLVGASSFAHEVMVDALDRPGRSRVVSLFSTSDERGRAFAEQHGVATVHRSLEELLADPEVDAVYISTTNDLHASQVVAAAGAGKHVLCEKPLATSLDDARQMRAACVEADVIFAVNHHMRCQETVRTMRRLISAGTIDEVLAVRVANLASLVEHRRTWRVNHPKAGAGVVLDLTVHDVDTVRYLLADEIVAVTAMTASQGVAEGPIEDGVMGTMRTRRGTLVSFHDAFTIGHGGSALELHGRSGSLIARDLFGATPSGEVTLRRGDTVEAVALEERPDPYVRGVEAFLDAVAGRGQPAATADDGIASLAVALAVLEAAATGSTVSPGFP
jgi:1,5-anhydro-D-fructose reductase (1,5-anhydro-D-mannitol-forming)